MCDIVFLHVSYVSFDFHIRDETCNLFYVVDVLANPGNCCTNHFWNFFKFKTSVYYWFY